MTAAAISMAASAIAVEAKIGRVNFPLVRKARTTEIYSSSLCVRGSWIDGIEFHLFTVQMIEGVHSKEFAFVIRLNLCRLHI